MKLEKINMPQGWTVKMYVDEDDHLNILASNEDDTETVDISPERSDNTTHVRLSTLAIEEEFQTKQEV